MNENKSKRSTLWKVCGLFLIMTVVTGIIYPLAVTAVSQIVFRDKANGSVIEIDGKKYGSELLAQQFTGEEYLWGRIMNIDTGTYVNENGETLMYSAPSNLSPTSEEYKMLVEERVEKLQTANPDAPEEQVPVDLVTSSGSGLDPHISPAAADYQVARIAKARGMEEADVQNVIDQYTDGRLFGVLGEEIVNVLEVNLALDGILK